MNIYMYKNCKCEDCKCENCGKTLLEIEKCECGCECDCKENCNCEDCKCEDCKCENCNCEDCNCEDCNCENCKCNSNIELLNAKTADTSVEKHVPVVNIDGENVEVVVGSTLHPMEEKHYIEYIILETEKGAYVRYLNPGEEPKANFVLAKDEKVKAAYEYCNIHGLWKNELN